MDGFRVQSHEMTLSAATSGTTDRGMSALMILLHTVSTENGNCL